MVSRDDADRSSFFHRHFSRTFLSCTEARANLKGYAHFPEFGNATSFSFLSCGFHYPDEFSFTFSAHLRTRRQASFFLPLFFFMFSFWIISTDLVKCRQKLFCGAPWLFSYSELDDSRVTSK